MDYMFVSPPPSKFPGQKASPASKLPCASSDTFSDGYSWDGYVEKVLQLYANPDPKADQGHKSALSSENYIERVMNTFVHRIPDSPTPSQMSDGSTDAGSNSDWNEIPAELSQSNRSNSDPLTPRSSILKKKGHETLRRTRSWGSIQWKQDEVLEFRKDEVDESYKTFKPRFAVVNGQRVTLEEDQQVVTNMYGQQFVVDAPKPARPQPSSPPRSYCAPQQQQPMYMGYGQGSYNKGMHSTRPRYGEVMGQMQGGMQWLPRSQSMGGMTVC